MKEIDRPRSSQPPAQAEEGLVVAILLALATTVAAILGARAAVVSSAASGAWQTAVREEVKRSAALVEDVRYVYAVEAAVALRAAAAAVEANELRQSVESPDDAEKVAAESAAFIRQTSADALAGAFDLTKDPRYHSGDGYDVVARLADVRNEHPELVALDPGATMDKGSEDSLHGRRLVTATILAAVGFAFLGLAAAAAVLVEVGVA